MQAGAAPKEPPLPRVVKLFLLLRVDHDRPATDRLVEAVVVDNHFIAVLVPNLDTERVGTVVSRPEHELELVTGRREPAVDRPRSFVLGVRAAHRDHEELVAGAMEVEVSGLELELRVAGRDRRALLVLGHEPEVGLALQRNVELVGSSVRVDPTASGHEPAFAAIVLAVAATEIQYDERLASYLWTGPLTGAQGKAIRDEDHLWGRIRALLKSLGGALLDSDEPHLYQEFVALVKLRHSLIHRSAEYLDTEDWPEKLKPCVEYIPYKRGPGLDWTSRVLCEEVAAGTAETLMNLVERQVPLPPGQKVAVKPVVLESTVVEPSVDPPQSSR